MLFIAIPYLEFIGHVMVYERTFLEFWKFEFSPFLLSDTITWPLNSRCVNAIYSTDPVLSETSVHITSSDHVMALKSKNDEY